MRAQAQRKFQGRLSVIQQESLIAKQGQGLPVKAGRRNPGVSPVPGSIDPAAESPPPAADQRRRCKRKDWQRPKPLLADSRQEFPRLNPRYPVPAFIECPRDELTGPVPASFQSGV